MTIATFLTRRTLTAALFTAFLAAGPTTMALADNPYQAAVPALEEAGGGKTCVECFLEKYGPAEFNKAFAVSKDGAYGGHWRKSYTMDQVREKALQSCRKKPTYTPANPCVIFMENDQLVWKP